MANHDTRLTPLAVLVDRQASNQIPLLSNQIVFKETDENFERLQAIAKRAKRTDNLTARAVFRIGLDVLEKAIEGGLL